MKFTNIRFRNFQAYGNVFTTINLENAGTTLIVGENLDDTSNGISGNGVGKTSIMNALVYALYDKAISTAITKEDLVNNINKKQMEVILDFVGDDGMEYQIHRMRKMKAADGNSVILYVNGKDETPASLDLTNQRIEQAVGIPYEVFVRLVVFSASHTPFFDLKLSDQRNIIEELFGLTAISEKAEVLKAIIKDNNDAMSTKKLRITFLEEAQTRHNTQLANAKERVIAWQVQTDADLALLMNNVNVDELPSDMMALISQLVATNDDLKQQVKASSAQIRLEAAEAIDEIQEKTKKATDKLRGKIKTQTTDLRETLSQYTSTLIEMNGSVTDISHQMQALNTSIKNNTQLVVNSKQELAHLTDAKCPYCLQQFADAGKKISETEETIRLLNVDIETSGATLDDLVTLCESKREEVANVKAEISKNELLIQTITNDIESDIKDITTIADEQIRQKLSQVDVVIKESTQTVEAVIAANTIEIDRLRQSTQTAQQRFDKLKTLQSAVNPYVDPLDELLAVTLEPVDYTEINKLTTEIEHQKFLLKLLTKSDSFIRKALLNKNIPYLNTRLHLHLGSLGLPHKVEFTKEMTAGITLTGRDFKFGMLSSGQQARVNFALALAFRDVLQRLHPKINVWMLDEVLDHSLCPVGKQLAAKLVKHKARDEGLSMYIISHSGDIDSIFDHKLTVQMSGGFSSIKGSDDV